MSDRGWILNPAAIAAAKACIHIVQEELGVKLKLSHPQFIELLHEYCSLTESEELVTAYLKLMSFAGPDEEYASLKAGLNLQESPEGGNDGEGDRVTYKGKSYLRYDQNGREFQGLYRGGARYA
jgi:hypothetical protein